MNTFKSVRQYILTISKKPSAHWANLCLAIAAIAFLAGCSNGYSASSGVNKSKFDTVQCVGTCPDNLLGKFNNAMTLLLSKHPEGYLYVLDHILFVDVDADVSGAHVHGGKLTLTRDFVELSSLPYLASAIVHDARHVEARHGCSIENEIDAINLQIHTLKKVGGGKHEIKHLQALKGIHNCADV